jgi:hypothetical protein
MTYNIEKTPGTYILGTRSNLYNKTSQTTFRVEDNPSDNNCTSVCLGVGTGMGLAMPNANETLTLEDVKIGPWQFKVEYAGTCPLGLYKAITTGN